jgi:SNF2 family DNA or RNA helicase
VQLVCKEDVLKLPEKIYDRIEFDLNPEQRSAYDQIAEEFMAILGDGSLVTAPLALTRLLRLQQITSGFVPVDTLDDVDEIPYADLGKTNPRLEKLEATCKASTEKRIIWCRFRRSIEKCHGDARQERRPLRRHHERR